MPGWLSETDVWVKLATVLTAALTLMTTLVGFWKTLAPAAEQQRITTAPRLRLLSLEAYSKPWSPYWLKSFFIVAIFLGPLMVALGLWVFVSEPSAGTAFPVLFFAACTVVNLVSARRLWRNPQQGSGVKREATVNVQGNYDQVWDECIAALKRMKVKVRTVDAEKGLIEGSTDRNWKSWGNIVTVQITKIGADQCSIHVKSDSRMIITAFDFGESSSSIQRFVDELVH
jgi:hypothetical protein